MTYIKVEHSLHLLVSNIKGEKQNCDYNTAAFKDYKGQKKAY